MSDPNFAGTSAGNARVSDSKCRQVRQGSDHAFACGDDALVLEALAHRFGWHETGATRTVSGTLDPAPSLALRWAEAQS